jgi:hypothetical protein
MERAGLLALNQAIANLAAAENMQVHELRNFQRVWL